MIEYTLPETVMVCGQEVPIRSDYRAILDICVAMQDIDLTDIDKAYEALKKFYKTEIPITEEALKQVFRFINCGQENAENKKQVKLFDWEQDFNLIIAPINRLMGCDVRGIPYLHWWTFMGCFQEIGESLFSRVIAIRSKRAKGKKLDEADKEFFRDNKELVDFKRKKYKPSVLLQQLLESGEDNGV